MQYSKMLVTLTLFITFICNAPLDIGYRGDSHYKRNHLRKATYTVTREKSNKKPDDKKKSENKKCTIL